MFDEYEAIITKNPIFLERTKNTGIITKEMGLDYGITGPNIRASGVNFDLRKTNPYSIYNELNFNACIANNCDSYDRYLVRVAEMRESVKIIKQAIQNIPDGDLTAKKINMLTFKPPAGESLSMVEAPRGITVCHVISDGTAKPYRVKWRTPSFSNVQIMPELVKDRIYSDLMAVFGSLDVVLPEVD